MVLEQVYDQTQGLDKAEKLSNRIESGILSVNNVVAPDPRVPFGGVRRVALVEGCQDTQC
jgi:acyl-CoA reductase-like NAD-dependent aldehyde dehydrogenase